MKLKLVRPSLNDHGEANLLVVMIIVLCLVVAGLGGLSLYYYSRMHTAVTTVEEQKQEAAGIAKEEQKKQDEADFIEREKEPYRLYEAPAVLGPVRVEFPKTWNVYAAEDEKASLQLDVFMYPGVVRAEKSTTDAYAFRLQLSRRLYPDTVAQYQKQVDKAVLNAQAVEISGIKGIRYNGQFKDNANGSIILLPIRDKTLLVWTESQVYIADFNQILTKVVFSP